MNGEVTHSAVKSVTLGRRKSFRFGALLVMIVKPRKRLLPAVFILGSLIVFARGISGQSADQSLPTPVLSNEVSGTIKPLDLGDARLTRHFYAFEATPGDLVITVNSRNLNGDVDIFTAVTFRPLTKISIYANTIPPEVTKGLYFRTRQILILRVEARTPNDDVGAYRITFSGSFQTFTGGIPVAENVEPATGADEKETRRVSSVGATIEQPPSELKPEESKVPEVAAEKPLEEPAKEPTPGTTRRNPTRTSRTRPPRTPRPRPPKTETVKTDPVKTDETKTAATEGEEKSAEKPAPQETPAAGPHLIIEAKDGTRIDRPMSTVRRVIVEANVIVIILKTGRIERIPMSTVARMAIEP